MSANFKLIYRHEESKWFGGEVPIFEWIDNSSGLIPDPLVKIKDGRFLRKTEYEKELQLAISNFKPIAPQDQEKVKRLLAISDDYWVPQEGSGTWQPDPSKLYDIGELEFELKCLENGHNEILKNENVSCSCPKFWVLKSKVEEKPKEEKLYTREQMKEIWNAGVSYASSYDAGYPRKEDDFQNAIKNI